MAVQVSVVVPTCRRPDLLDRCLQALLAQDFDPSAYEVIVVDDAADLHTRRQVEEKAAHLEAYAFAPGLAVHIPEWASLAPGEPAIDLGQTTGQWIRVAGLPRLRYIPVLEKRGPAAARNRGWQAAEGEIIAFTDDDCIPVQGWLKNGVQAFVDGVVGVTGRVIVPVPPNPTDYERDVAGLEGSEFITANCFYRRSALEAMGGFDENFTMPWREDSDLFFRFLEGGYPLAEASEAVVVHPVRQAPWGVSLRQQRKSQFNALAYKKHPELYREKLQPEPPWHYYKILAALVTGLAAWLAGVPALAVLMALVWAVLTLRFSFQRLQGTTYKPSHVVEMLVTSALIPPLCIFWRLVGAVKFQVLFL